MLLHPSRRLMLVALVALLATVAAACHAEHYPPKSADTTAAAPADTTTHGDHDKDHGKAKGKGHEKEHGKP